MTQLQAFGRQQSSRSDASISPPPLDELTGLDYSSFNVNAQSHPVGLFQASNRESVARLFQSLPSEVIQRLLWTVDANSFASLALLNHKWYTEAQQLELYAHHLSRCPSYALTNNLITGPFRRNDLFRLKTKFAAEVRRNLFEAYMRPRETLVNLIAINANSSAAFPGGEAFRFAFSPNGQTILALSSSRIYVLDVTKEPIVVRKELKTLRKPLSASITDDGSLLAVLSSKHQANIYGLTEDGVRHLQVLVLDHPPRTIALAHEGTVLAAAYEGGVEVFSLAVNALSTDRRAVRSEAVDTLNFSGDGSMLVGSSQSLDEPHAVVINAPFYTENDPNLTSREIHSRMWTTQILFPQISSICSHAELLQGHSEGDATWLFAYDHALMSYRAVRTDDTRSGVAYFLNPLVSRRYSMPLPSIAPTASACGTLVVAGFSGQGLWIYGVPERLDVSPDMGSVVERHEHRVRGRIALTSATGAVEPLMAYSPSVSGSSEEIEEDSLASKVDWRQSLFVKCRHLKSMESCTATKWVERPEDQHPHFPGKRLVIVAPGGVNAFAEELGEESMPVDGSRICLLDFDYSPFAGENREITIEVGENEAELLTEHIGDLDVEVALERRRTVRNTRQGAATQTQLSRSRTTAAAGEGDHFEPITRSASISQPSSPNDSINPNNGGALFPQRLSSLPSNLQRSATASGVFSARYPPRPPLGSTSYLESGHVIYNRPARPPDSEEGWETPPPPYQSGSPALATSTEDPSVDERPRNLERAAETAPRHENCNVSDISESSRVADSQTVSSPNDSLQTGESFTSGPRSARRASTTLDGVMLSDRAPTKRLMNQFGGLATTSRTRGISGSSLEAVAEPPEEAQSTGNDSQLLPQTHILSSSDRQQEESPYNIQTRQASSELTPPRKPLPMRATITSPMSLPSSIQEQEIFIQEVDRDKPSPARSSPLTLSGANLQNRLNHPVPPVPNDHDPENTKSKFESDPMPPKNRTSAHQSSQSAHFLPPTPDQMANLNRRMSQTHNRSFSLTSNIIIPHNRQSNGAGGFMQVPPSPPRGAWGAAGVPGSPSFNKAANSPNGLSRSNSRPKTGSLHVSSSTPDLRGSQRPKYGRLDTIESVGSSVGYADAGTRSRAQSVALDTVPTIPERSPFAESSEARRDFEQPSKRKKAKRKKTEEDRNLVDVAGRTKRGSRCVVM